MNKYIIKNHLGHYLKDNKIHTKKYEVQFIDSWTNNPNRAKFFINKTEALEYIDTYGMIKLFNVKLITIEEISDKHTN